MDSFLKCSAELVDRNTKGTSEMPDIYDYFFRIRSRSVIWWMCNAGEDSKDDHDNQQLHKGEALLEQIAALLAVEQCQLKLGIEGSHC